MLNSFEIALSGSLYSSSGSSSVSDVSSVSRSRASSVSESESEFCESELKVLVEGQYCKVYEQSAKLNKNWIMHLVVFLGMRPSIVTLDLIGILLSEMDIQVIGLLTGIQKLGLDNCSLSSEKLHMLSSLSLQELSLKSNPVSDLGFLKNMRKLKSLNLANTEITDDDVGVLSGLNLEQLDLSHTAIGDHGANEICEIETLVVLDVSFTEIVYFQSIRKLCELSNLKLINIDGYQFSQPLLELFLNDYMTRWTDLRIHGMPSLRGLPNLKANT